MCMYHFNEPGFHHLFQAINQLQVSVISDYQIKGLLRYYILNEG